MDTVFGTDFGLRASLEDRAEVSELVTQLEAANPTLAPVEEPGFLNEKLGIVVHCIFRTIASSSSRDHTFVENVSDIIDN